MDKICPFMSTYDDKVDCTNKCALCTTSGKCMIIVEAGIVEEMSKKVDGLATLVVQALQRR